MSANAATTTVDHHRGIRAVAVFELVKAVVVLVAGIGLVTLIGQDVQAAAESIVEILHLDPQRHYPQMFIAAAGEVTDDRLKTLILLAALYSTIKIAEGYGLWHLKPWAEWLAVISSGLYLPVEIYEIFVAPTWFRAAFLAGNLLVVGYLLSVLLENRRKRRILLEHRLHRHRHHAI